MARSLLGGLAPVGVAGMPGTLGGELLVVPGSGGKGMAGGGEGKEATEPLLRRPDVIEFDRWTSFGMTPSNLA